MVGLRLEISGWRLCGPDLVSQTIRDWEWIPRNREHLNGRETNFTWHRRSFKGAMARKLTYSGKLYMVVMVSPERGWISHAILV